MSRLIQRAAAITVIAFVLLWSADYVWLGITLVISAEPDVSHSPSISRLIAQSGLFGLLFAGFVSAHATARHAISFGVVAGLFAWIPEHIYLFRRVPLIDWDVRYLLALLGLSLGTGLQWALLGYLSGRVSRAIGVESRAA